MNVGLRCILEGLTCETKESKGTNKEAENRPPASLNKRLINPDFKTLKSMQEYILYPSNR